MNTGPIPTDPATDTPDEEWALEELPYWECPYLARWNNEPGHDPQATCTFGCTTEPACVTCGPWPERERTQ